MNTLYFIGDIVGVCMISLAIWYTSHLKKVLRKHYGPLSEDIIKEKIKKRDKKLKNLLD